MPQRICAEPTCRERVDIPERYCEEHRGHSDKQYNKHVRTNDFNKKYDDFYHSSQWRKTRKAKLMQHPLCEVCAREGRMTKADMVHHHKYELREPGGWENRLSLDNLQSICYACHNGIHHEYSWKNRGGQ